MSSNMTTRFSKACPLYGKNHFDLSVSLSYAAWANFHFRILLPSFTLCSETNFDVVLVLRMKLVPSLGRVSWMPLQVINLFRISKVSTDSPRLTTTIGTVTLAAKQIQPDFMTLFVVVVKQIMWFPIDSARWKPAGKVENCEHVTAGCCDSHKCKDQS